MCLNWLYFLLKSNSPTHYTMFLSYFQLALCAQVDCNLWCLQVAGGAVFLWWNTMSGCNPIHHSIVDSITLMCSDVEGVVIQSGKRADFLLSVSVFFFWVKNHQKATECFEKGIFCSLCFVIRLWVRSLLDWIMMILTSEFALYVILYSAIWCMNVLVLQAFYARCCGQNSKILQFSCWLSKGSPVRSGPLTLEPLVFLSLPFCLLSSSLQVQICPLFCVGLLIRFFL